jgi:hypothetical protein
MTVARHLPPVFVTLAIVAAGNLSRAEEPRQAEDAKAIIDKSLKALGGVEKISKLHAACLKGTCSFKGKEKFSFDGTFAALDKVRFVVEPSDFTNNKRMIFVLNGDKGWTKLGEAESEEISAEGRLEGTFLDSGDILHALGLPDLLMTLKGNGYTLATLEEQKIDGHDAVGLRVTHKNHQEVRLFFDKTSALPIKSEVKLVAKRADGTQKEILVELFFSKYKEIAGVSHFTRVRIHFDDDDLEINLKEVELPEKVDAAVFAKP